MPQKLPIGIQDFRKIIENNFKYVDKTSVSKFSKVAIFSGLNNLQDITTHPRYATMLGYTQTELEDNFAAEIVATAEHLKLSREELLQKLKYWYNGYCFHANEGSVYNPVSINLFFNTHDFRNYWFETGTPTFLINLLKQHGLYNFIASNWKTCAPTACSTKQAT